VQWDKEMLLDAFYSDPEGTTHAAGAYQGSIARQNAVLAKGGQFWCTVLYEMVPMEHTFSMGCERPNEPEHRFSTEAWQEYLINKIADGFSSIFTQCLSRGCKCIVSPRVWRTILSATPPLSAGVDPAFATTRAKTLEKYEYYLSNSFVDMNRNVKWCTGQDCGWAVAANGPVNEAECDHCHHKFCFKCRKDAHAPLSCKGLEMWMEKCTNESETANWVITNTKKCPQCNTYIEKNQGCNHMHCAMCKYEFCWICLGDWKAHSSTTGGYYNCNRFSEDSEKKKTAESAKRELERYIFYYSRYQGHQQALKFAAKQRTQAESRMMDMQRTLGMGCVDVQFVMDAAEQLLECRRVLMYTYPMAYYLEDGPRKKLFEYNQGMLEANTEELSRLTELAIDRIDRATMVNYTRVTAKFRTSLLEEVAREEREGFGRG